MIKLYNYLFIIIILFLLYSCKSDSLYNAPRFTHKKVVDLELLSDNLSFNSVNDMYIYDNYVIIVAFDNNTSTYIHIYDKNTGKHIRSGVQRGRGPNETIFGQFNSHFDPRTGVVSMFDFMNRSIIKMDISKFLIGDAGAIYSTEFHPNFNTKVFPLNDSMFLWINNFSPVSVDKAARFIVTDDLGDAIYELDKFPYDENTWFRYNLYNSLYYDITPDRDKLAIISNYGLVVEIYELLNDSIRERTTKYYIEPTIGNEKEYNNDDTILGVNDVYVTDSAIYSAYDGEHYGNVPSSQFYNNIAVFDWNGNPKSLYKTNMRVLRVCCDDNTDELYAVVENKDESTYLARICCR